MFEAVNQSRSNAGWMFRDGPKDGLAVANDHRPEISLEQSLRAACGSITRSAAADGLHVRLGLQVSGAYLVAWRDWMVRAVSELVSNAVEHGFYRRQTGRVLVQVTYSPDAETQVVVSDDGWGFPAEPVIDGNGFRLLRSLGVLQIEANADPRSMRTVITLFVLAQL